MSRSKDRIARTLRRCLRMLKQYHGLAVGGDWKEEDELAVLIKEVEKATVYREFPVAEVKGDGA